MKKSILFYLLLLVLNVSAQPKIEFEVGYKPNITYLQTITQSITNVAYMEGGAEPKKKYTELTITAKTKVKSYLGNELPFEMMVVISKNNKGVVNSEEAIIYGVFKGNGEVSMDSIHSEKMIPLAKELTLSMMKNIISQLIIPKKSMKIGEQYSLNTDVKSSILTSEVITKKANVYKLINIEDNKAIFEVSENSIIETNDNTTIGSVLGKGKIIYDVKSGVATSYEVTNNTEISLEDMGRKNTLNSESKIKISTVINY